MTAVPGPQEAAEVGRGSCPIGPLGLHTLNHERTECIWCGPGRLAWADGVWVKQADGSTAWSVPL